MPTRIQLRRGTATQWASANPVLAGGEVGYDSTNDEMRVGNGTDTWDALEPISGGVEDHGALTGLSDDDHPQYALADGSRAFTGPVGGVNAVADTDLATKQQLDNATSGLVDAITDGDTLSWHEGDRITVAASSNHTVVDVTSGGADLLGGTLYGANIGLRLTVDGTVVANRTTTRMADDTGADNIGVVAVPAVQAATSLKLEIVNTGGADRRMGWRVATR